MSALTAEVLHLLFTQLGSASAQQLRQAGVSERGRRTLIGSHTLIPIGHSVYRIPTLPFTPEARSIALCLQHPSGFITGPTGGSRLNLRKMPPAAQIHFCVPHGHGFTPPNWVRLRQSNRVLAHHVRQLENGLRMASAERLAFDLASDLRVPDLSSVVEQMIQRSLVSIESLGEIAIEMCGPRRPGSTVFARMLLRRGVGAAAESHPELLVLDGLRTRGVPVEAQQRLELPNGRSIRIDMAVPRVRWAVEVDVHPDHFALEGSTRDVQRDRQLHLIEWQVDRVTTIDLLDLHGTLDELVALYRRRCTSLASSPRSEGFGVGR